MKRRTSIAVACLVFAACGGGPHIEARDLARVMPSALDAPVGTDIDQSTVGPQTIDEFITDATVKARLSKLGFRTAYLAAFTTRNFIPDIETAPVGSAYYGTFAVVLRDGDAASAGFDFYTARFRSKSKGFTPLVIDGIGEEVFAFRFSELDDTRLPGLAIFWRTGNALFSVVGVGNPGDQNATRRLATTIDRRAAAV